MEASDLKIVVVGAGGVGGYFGAQLAAAGHDVVFIARGRQLEALREHGLRVESDSAPQRLPEVRATDELTEVDHAELVLIAVKLWDTEDVVRRLAPLARGGAAVISLQNGVQKDDVLAAHLPAGSALGGACYISAAIEAPGVIRHNGALARIVFGEYDGERTARATQIYDAFTQAGIETELSDDITTVLWRKFVFLVGLSSVTSATRQPVGVLRANPRTRELLYEVMAEVSAVGRAQGAGLPADFAQQQLEFCDTLPPQMSSSMLTDLEHGHRLELPWLGAAVVEMGKRSGVATPYNAALAAALDPYVDGAGS
jgi:2-dehydropantoate 2-reductase